MMDTRRVNALAAPRAVVIGAGMGGLAAALALATRGVEVTVVERAARPGGKMREVEVGGVPIDAGPTVLTMRPVLEGIFAEAGSSLGEHLTLKPAEILARHAWGPDERLDLFADIERSADAIGRFAGAAEAGRFRQFCAQARRIFTTLERPFIHAPQPSLPGLMSGAAFGDLWRIKPFATMWGALGEYFHDPRLRQLFGRYATYCGSSPFLAPATLMLVAHVEQEGVWLVEGGMHRLATALMELATRQGARFRFGAEASEVLLAQGRVAGVRLGTGEAIPCEAAVVNADIGAISAGRLGGEIAGAVPRVPPSARSLSAVTWALLAETGGFPLLRHNVFFSGDYPAEFKDIFEARRLPRRPTVYVCAQDRDAADRPRALGLERLLCLVNAPPLGDADPPGPTEISECETRTFELLERCGLRVERQAERCTVTTPWEFERLFPATGGALYGQASHGWRASFNRPGVRTRLPGLYLAGGSAHPGPGVPMAALSGRMAAACLLADLASTSRSAGTAMRGGTSMP